MLVALWLTKWERNVSENEINFSLHKAPSNLPCEGCSCAGYAIPVTY